MTFAHPSPQAASSSTPLAAFKREQERRQRLIEQFIKWGDEVLADPHIPSDRKLILRAIHRAQLEQQLDAHDMTKPQLSPTLELVLWNAQPQAHREQITNIIHTLLKKGGR